jgi:hypothetical protein
LFQNEHWEIVPPVTNVLMVLNRMPPSSIGLSIGHPYLATLKSNINVESEPPQVGHCPLCIWLKMYVNLWTILPNFGEIGYGNLTLPCNWRRKFSDNSTFVDHPAVAMDEEFR